MLAAVQTSLLSLAASTFLWATGYQSGGLLNDFLTITKDGITNVVGLRSMNLAMLQDILRQNLFAGVRQSYPILDVLPTSLGGGAAGVKEAQAHPGSTNVLTILLIFSSLLVFLLCLTVALLSFGCCCVKCCEEKCRRRRSTPVLTASFISQDFHFNMQILARNAILLPNQICYKSHDTLTNISIVDMIAIYRFQ